MWWCCSGDCCCQPVVWLTAGRTWCGRCLCSWCCGRSCGFSAPRTPNGVPVKARAPGARRILCATPCAVSCGRACRPGLLAHLQLFDQLLHVLVGLDQQRLSIAYGLGFV